MKKIFALAASAFMLFQLSGAELTECFVKGRIYKEDVPWNKYYSPQFVEANKDGRVTIRVKRVPGGPVGGMMKYFVKLDQKKASPITISLKCKADGFKGKAGYHYRVGAAFYYVGGGHQKTQYIHLPGASDGKWHDVSKTFTLNKPIREVHFSLALCYRDGVAEFKDISIKTDKAALVPSAAKK